MNQPRCRLCRAVLQSTVIDLGTQPLANHYLDPAEVASEKRYPLHARLCEGCGLVQVDDVVPAEDIFGDYAYFSSYSDSWVEHARRYTVDAGQRLDLGPNDLVVEVASNDGYLLQWFVRQGIRVLGVEPARNVAEVAIERGVPTAAEFFGASTAAAIRDEQGPARLIVANNVMAHVPDLNDFVAGFAALLAPGGYISVEVPHLANLIRHTQFDTIYHEHYSYFSLLAASAAFERHGLCVVDVEQVPTHGGSLRIWVQHEAVGQGASDAVTAVLADEKAALLDRPEGYTSFADRAEKCRDGLLAFLTETASGHERVAAYGAAAKGNTLLNYAGIGVEDIPYVVDRSPHKQGKLLPGSHLPVRDPSVVDEDRPDFLLVLPWNLRDEITAQMAGIRAWGGKFVTAVPVVKIF